MESKNDILNVSLGNLRGTSADRVLKSFEDYAKFATHSWISTVGALWLNQVVHCSGTDIGNKNVVIRSQVVLGNTMFCSRET